MRELVVLGIFVFWSCSNLCWMNNLWHFSVISVVNSQSIGSFFIFLLFSCVISTLETIKLETRKKLDYSNFLFSYISFVAYMNHSYGPTGNLLSHWTFGIEISFALRNCASNVLYVLYQNQQILLHLYCVTHKSLSVFEAKK